MSKASFFMNLGRAMDDVRMEQSQARLQRAQAANALLSSIAQSQFQAGAAERERKAAAERTGKAMQYLNGKVSGAMEGVDMTSPDYRQVALGRGYTAALDDMANWTDFDATDLQGAMTIQSNMDDKTLSAILAAKEDARKAEIQPIAIDSAKQDIAASKARVDQADRGLGLEADRIDISRQGQTDENRRHMDDLTERARQFDEGLAADMDKLWATFQQQLDLEGKKISGRKEVKALTDDSYKSDSSWIAKQQAFKGGSSGKNIIAQVLAGQPFRDRFGDALDLSKNVKVTDTAAMGKNGIVVMQVADAAVDIAIMNHPDIPAAEKASAKARLKAVYEEQNASVDKSDRLAKNTMGTFDEWTVKVNDMVNLDPRIIELGKGNRTVVNGTIWEAIEPFIGQGGVVEDEHGATAPPVVVDEPEESVAAMTDFIFRNLEVGATGDTSVTRPATPDTAKPLASQTQRTVFPPAIVPRPAPVTADSSPAQAAPQTTATDTQAVFSNSTTTQGVALASALSDSTPKREGRVLGTGPLPAATATAPNMEHFINTAMQSRHIRNAFENGGGPGASMADTFEFSPLALWDRLGLESAEKVYEATVDKLFGKDAKSDRGEYLNDLKMLWKIRDNEK